MSGDPVATVTVPLTLPDAGTSATVTFFSDKSSPSLLHFKDVSHSGWEGSLVNASWTQASSYFYWANNIRTLDGQSTIFTGIIWASTNVSSLGIWPASDHSIPLTIAALTSGSSATMSLTPTGTSDSSTSSTSTKTTTAAPSSSSSKSETRKGLSSGAVAGIATGCLLAGALIAGLLVWLCLGKARKRRTSQDQESSAVALMHHREKASTSKAMSVETGTPISQATENGLPQPLEDKAISGEISKISNLIKNHVQSYYHTDRVSPALVDLDDLQPLGINLPISAGTLSTLLGNKDTREIALRFCIAWIMIARMQLHSDPTVTFLPPEIARGFQSMAYVDRGSRVQTVFLARWRALSAELMQSTYVRNAFSASDSRSRNIVAASDALEGILRPYADSRVDNSQRQRNLDEILKRAATFAFTLFSQPSSWDFDWRDEQGVMSGSLCVFPALVQVTDETGEPVKPPRAFSEAVVRRLDG